MTISRSYGFYFLSPRQLEKTCAIEHGFATASLHMTVTVHIPASLRSYCHEDRSELMLSAATVREALEQLERNQPAIYQSICDETGAIRRHIHLFVNNSFISDRQGLETTLAPGDVLSIVPAVSGG